VTPDDVRRVLATAVRAPSVHNTQPWRFAVTGDVLEVHADRTRQLHAQDPDGRELVLSCGAAALHARLAVRGLGRDCRTTWLPDEQDRDLVARLEVGGPRPATPDEQRLLEAVELRHTDRSAFAADPVAAGLVDELRAAAEHEGGWLADEQRPDQVLGVEVLVSRADRALRRDAAVREELRGWVRGGLASDDGVPVDALPDEGRGRGSSLELRSFDPDAGREQPAADAPPAAEHPLLLVLGTPAETPADWARAGAALARVLLTATSRGLVANPQTQVMEVPSLRASLRSTLGLAGEPQVLLRIGWPRGPGSPRTGRRPVEAVLDQG